MKQLIDTIKEAKQSFQIFSEAKHSFRIKSHLKKQVYKYTPKDRLELCNIIIDEINSKDENVKIIDLNHIDTSNIIDFKDLFPYVRTKVKQQFGLTFDVSEWNTSNAIYMNGLFRGCIAFNGDLSNWDVSKVKDMRAMFKHCREYEGKGLENWKTSSLEYTQQMFYGDGKFNGDVSKWDMSNVYDADTMFYGCQRFNQDLSGWNIKAKCYKESMFEGCKSFKCDLNGWPNTPQYAQRNMFKGCPGMRRKNKPSWYI